MSLPAPSAGPNQVRAYITELLVNKHDYPRTDAAKIASKWSFSTARYLRAASRYYFDEDFGFRLGWQLHESIREGIYEESNRTAMRRATCCMNYH